MSDVAGKTKKKETGSKRNVRAKRDEAKSESKPVSERKVRANRANAKKSTGPTSAHGKRVCSRNPLRHGFRSSEVVIAKSGERVEEYKALLDDVRAEFKPATGIEQVLVERVAVSLWRLRRAQRFEIGAVGQAIDECSRTDTEVAETLGKLQGRLGERIEELEYLREALESIRNLTGLEDPKAAARVRPRLLDIADDLAPSAADMPTVELHKFLLDRVGIRIEGLDDEIPRLDAQIKELTDRENSRLERSSLTGSLPAPQEVLKLVRYENMLDRQLHRALTQLKRRKRVESHEDEVEPCNPEAETS